MNPTLIAALSYAEKGLAVFPVKGKIPTTTHGFKDATTDETQIRLWWEREDPPGIAIATGNQFGLAVLDIDPRNGGEDSIELLLKDGVSLPDTPMVFTGGGGRHYYFSIPKSIPFSGRSAVRSGIDLKADGGYVVAPPSLHESGKRYVFEISSDIADVSLAPIPASLLDILKPKEEQQRAQGAPAVTPKPLPNAYVEGTRRTYLLSMIGLLRRKNLSQGAALAAVREENKAKCNPPLEEPELVALIGDSFKRWQAVESIKLAPERAMTIAPDDNLSDLGNARRFAEKVGCWLLYSYRESGWFGYDGSRWLRAATGMAEREAQKIPDDLHAEAKALIDAAKIAGKEGRNDDAERLKVRAASIAAWAKKSEGAGHIASTLKLAAAILEIEASVFDKNQMLLNFRNGTIDLVTGKLRAHDKADMITLLIDYDFDENALCPIFESFILGTMANRTDLANCVLRCLGYSLTGSTKEQVFFCCYGPTSANGKSTLFDIVRLAMGEYACGAPDGLLEERQSEQHPTQIATLKGRRFVTTVETGHSKRMAENLVKKLTGSDALTARRMYEDFTTFDPQHKLWLASNHRLKITLDPAILRRIVEIPFDVHFWDPKKNETGPEHLRQDPDLPEKLRAEIPGIMALMVRACLEWQATGIAAPNDILKSLDEYKAEMDTLGEWIEEECAVVTGAMTGSSDLFRHYIAWCEKNRKGKMSQTMFSTQLMQKGFEKRRGTASRMTFVGIGLKSQRFDDRYESEKLGENESVQGEAPF